MIPALQEILDIIWGKPKTKEPSKPPRDSKGRFIKYKKKPIRS